MPIDEPNALRESLQLLRKYKALGEAAIAQASDEELSQGLDEAGNSIAQIVKHLNGNMRSRWRDFLTSDGEKADRDREWEFEPVEGVTREQLSRWWEEGWSTVFDAIEPLTPADLSRTILLKGEPVSVLQGIIGQVAHYAYHVGQIVFLAKHFRSTSWKTVSHPHKR